MESDERAIRQVVDRWLEATSAGDLETVLTLMDEEVVFLLAGRPPMRGRKEFAESFKGMQGARIDGSSDVHEIQINGDWAYCWQSLTIDIKPAEGEPMHRQGDTLSIFRKLPSG